MIYPFLSEMSILFICMNICWRTIKISEYNGNNTLYFIRRLKWILLFCKSSGRQLYSNTSMYDLHATISHHNYAQKICAMYFTSNWKQFQQQNHELKARPRWIVQSSSSTLHSDREFVPSEWNSGNCP